MTCIQHFSYLTGVPETFSLQHSSSSNLHYRCFSFSGSELVMGVLYKSLYKMLLIDDIYTKEATNKSRFVCVCFSQFFCMFFWSLYVFHASSPPYTLKEEMNDESTEKYFQKKKQQQQQQQQNKTKRKLTSSMTPQYTIHLYMYYFLF